MIRFHLWLRRHPWMVAAWVMCFLAASMPAAAQDLGKAVAESYPTNLNMLTETATSSVNELLIGFAAPSGATLLVESAGDNEANWFVENLLLSNLNALGYSAYLKEGQPLGPAVPADLSDTTAAGEAVETQELSTPAAPPEYVLRYRVAEFGISYPDSYKKNPLGSRRVQRLSEVNLFAHLIKGEREDVIWVGRGQAQRIDVVPSSKLPLLEGRSFPFQRPVLETRGFSSLVEPALVTGIVAGLIYLFYTNQN